MPSSLTKQEIVEKNWIDKIRCMKFLREQQDFILRSYLISEITVRHCLFLSGCKIKIFLEYLHLTIESFLMQIEISSKL